MHLSSPINLSVHSSSSLEKVDQTKNNQKKNEGKYFAPEQLLNSSSEANFFLNSSLDKKEIFLVDLDDNIQGCILEEDSAVEKNIQKLIDIGNVTQDFIKTIPQNKLDILLRDIENLPSLLDFFSLEELLNIPDEIWDFSIIFGLTKKDITYFTSLASFPRTTKIEAIELIYSFDLEKTRLIIDSIESIKDCCLIFNISLKEFLFQSSDFKFIPKQLDIFPLDSPTHQDLERLLFNAVLARHANSRLCDVHREKIDKCRGSTTTLVHEFMHKLLTDIVFNHEEKFLPEENLLLKKLVKTTFFLSMVSKFLDRSQKEDAINFLIENINDLNNSAEFQFLLPGGYKAHAMIYGIQKDKNGYSFSIWNTAPGFNHSISPFDANKYQIRLDWTHLSFDEITNPQFLNELFTELGHSNPNKPYEIVESYLKKKPQNSNSNPLDYHKMQVGGNCAWKSYLAACLDSLERFKNPSFARKVNQYLIDSLQIHLEESSIKERKQNDSFVRLLLQQANWKKKILRKKS